MTTSNTNDIVKFDPVETGEVDSYQTNKATGTFILIDPKTNATSGVGFIQ